MANGDRPRLLFAVSPHERNLFFSQFEDWRRENPAHVIHWPDEDDLAEPAHWQNLLEMSRPQILVSCWSTPKLPEPWLDSGRCPLQYVCHVTGSIREIVPRFFLERGGRVTNWGSLAGREVAEHALLLALAALRKLPRWRSVQVEHGGPTSTELLGGTRTLFGRRVGLHGFGNVARSLLDLLRPFGAKVFGYSEGVPRHLMEARGVEPCDSLEELFLCSDVLFECEALTPKSSGSVTAECLAALPDGAVFVNVGRGQVVDEEALIREAVRGRILVALDVVVDEPFTPDAAIARVANVLLSPHIAGPTSDSLPLAGELALRNIDRFLLGQPLEDEVGLEIYDRST